jgi:hypothetical protein
MKTVLLLLSASVIVVGVTAVGISLFGLFSVTAIDPSGARVEAQVAPAGPVIDVPTKSEILNNATWGIENPELLDVRLLFSEEASQALGAGIVYEGEFFNKDDPVWVVAVKSGNARVQLPDIGQGNTKYAGVLWILNAADGQALMMSSIQDPNNDPRLARLKELPNREGTIPIVPRPVVPTVPPGPTPTAVPR